MADTKTASKPAVKTAGKKAAQKTTKILLAGRKPLSSLFLLAQMSLLRL